MAFILCFWDETLEFYMRHVIAHGKKLLKLLNLTMATLDEEEYSSDTSDEDYMPEGKVSHVGSNRFTGRFYSNTTF